MNSIGTATVTGSSTTWRDVVDDFAAAARDWPERTAILHNGTTISYQELAERIRETAKCYRAGRAGSSSRPVGALVTHTPAMVEHLIGILQAGAAYSPIAAALPDARIQSLAAVLGIEHLYATVPGMCGTAELRVKFLDRKTAAAETESPQPIWRPTDAAYVLCTSGSTGVPKPVVVSRNALSVTVRALRRLFDLTPDDRVLQFASLGWDTCLEEILPALTSGAALVFDDIAHSGSFPAFVRMLAELGITVLDLPTAFWHELVYFLHEEQATLPACVRLVVIGGERVDPTRLRQWRELGIGHVTLLNTYGCTETTMITHAVQLAGPGTEPEVAAEAAEAPLGRRLPHVRDHVTDEGELLVAGPSLADGYLGSPELTAAAFPLADHDCGPQRWFRTGDLVARGENGLLYPRGRIDEQVKVSGVRVHPAEIETQLITHPAVGGAVVVGERVLGRTSLAAYVVAVAPTTSGELKHYLRQRLPSQFVPSRISFVTSMKYTTSGKVDRAATQRAAEDHRSQGVER